MKTLKIAIFAILMTALFTVSNVMAQKDQKLVKAEKNFCNNLNKLVQALETLDQVNENSSMDEFNAAYKDAEKAWKKFQKSAEKLEKVEIKESQQAYNKLVDAVNSIDGDTKTSEAAGQINDHIDATAAEIEDILTVVCQ